MTIPLNEDTWPTIGFKFVLSAASHPIQVAKILIQIGHEPMPPYPTRTFFGKHVMALPNIFKYVKYINEGEGLAGCYRGLIPSLSAFAATELARFHTVDLMKVEDALDEHNIQTDKERRKIFLQMLLRDITRHSAGLVASHPFHVVAVRMIAQMVGHEESYSGLFSSVAAIYREEGCLGFFAGFVPRFLGDILSLVIASSVIFVVNRYIITDKEIRNYTAATTQFIVNAVTYPFHVVGACMAVNNCGLLAGVPPHMPIYRSWTHCWIDLYRGRQLKRGSSLLWRYCYEPSVKLAILPQPIK